MRRKLKNYGDVRYVKRFTLFPLVMRINPYDPLDTDEMVIWFETVYIKQCVQCGLYSKEWKNERLATREEYLEYKRPKKYKREEKV